MPPSPLATRRGVRRRIATFSFAFRIRLEGSHVNRSSGRAIVQLGTRITRPVARGSYLACSFDSSEEPAVSPSQLARAWQQLWRGMSLCLKLPSPQRNCHPELRGIDAK